MIRHIAPITLLALVACHPSTSEVEVPDEAAATTVELAPPPDIAIALTVRPEFPETSFARYDLVVPLDDPDMEYATLGFTSSLPELGRMVGGEPLPLGGPLPMGPSLQRELVRVTFARRSESALAATIALGAPSTPGTDAPRPDLAPTSTAQVSGRTTVTCAYELGEAHTPDPELSSEACQGALRDAGLEAWLGLTDR